jgi:SNF2 family DNA or RNA helicase
VAAPTKPAERKSMEPWIKDSTLYYQHQASGIREMALRRSFILAWDMGLGKSLAALTVFAIDVARGWAETCVIISPPGLKGNWMDEIEKFTGFAAVVMDGGPEERVRQLFEYMMIKGPKVLIMNYEYAYLEEKALANMRFDIAIYDEAHYIKNPEAKRTIAVLGVNSRRSFMLTGTPFLNQVNELWCLLHRVDPERFPRYYTFLNRYCVYGGYNNRSIVGVKNEKELMDLVHQYMFRLLKDDVLDLPEILPVERRVDLHPAQQELYDQINEELRYVNLDGDEEEIDNTLTKFLRLKQVCGTTLPFTGEDISAKLDQAIEDDLEVLRDGRKLVVFTQFRDVQAAHKRRLEAHGIPVFEINGDVPQLQRPEIAKIWSKTKEPAVFSSIIRVGAEGLNLTAARDMSFLDKDYTPGKMDQAQDRCRRIGADATQPIRVRSYICRGTVENRIEQILRTKRALFNQIVNDPARKREFLKLVLESEA